jgi:hypothetical protein
MDNNFDKLVNVLLEAARCKKVTGQQQSSRKDKKYMRCAKVDGKLKRVHYGDPKMRIKKSNPKRRKAFRSRHSCQNKKKGTPGYYSCLNW